MRYTTDEVVEAIRAALKTSRGAWSDMEPGDLEKQEIIPGLGHVDAFADRANKRFGILVVEHLVSARTKFDAAESARAEIESANLGRIWVDG